ncbi:nuclear distribution protein C [Cryptosporidium ryanae]|uniref:nuclear distribution protein C n=1 Tax=Cryptosporidium ryanae TaxID=515981 RepID=UPI00351A216C|nr:nuclear distribution protein C [Cryptosporidium ryanae]
MEERFDPLLINIAQTANGIENFLDVIFSFLLRKTDFFTAMEQGEEERVLMKYFKKYQALSVDKRKEAKRLLLEREEERKRKLEEKRISEDSKMTNKIEEIFSDEECTEEQKLNKEKCADGAEDDNDADSDSSPPIGNGGKTNKYTWTQTLGTLEMLICTNTQVKSRDCKIDIGSNKLKVVIKGAEYLNGEFHSKVKPDDCIWSIIDGNTIQIVLEKQENMSWWPCVLKGDPEIDTSKIVPENSKLSDLDPETRATVEKMMFDQRQKAMGLPTSDHLKQHELLEKFKAAHPEMDFSQAKINYGN